MPKYLDKPIIFIGFPRSGTTIISEIVMQHQDLAWVSNYQSYFPKSKGINLVRNIFQNPLWKITGQKKQLNKVPLFNKYIFMPSEAYHFWNTISGRPFGESFLFKVSEEKAKVQQLRVFFNAMVRFQNRKRLAFKLTGPSRLEYLSSIFPDAIFVRIKRNVLPAMRSLLKVGFWNEGRGKQEMWWNQKGIYSDQELEFAMNTSAEPSLLAALQYYKVNKIHDIELSKTDAKVIDIDYEAFINEPDEVIQKIVYRVELDIDQNICNYLKRNKIYNRNRKEGSYFSKELDKAILNVAKGRLD